MKYYFKHEALESVVNALSIAASEKDAKIVVVFGEMGNEKEICNVAMCLGGTVQVNMKFLCERPEGFEQPEKYAFDAKIFLTLVQNCLSLKEKTYLETANGICTVGVDEKAEFAIPVLSLEEVQDGIPMDPSKTLVQCAVKANEFLNALRSGAYATGCDQFANALFILRGEEVFIYSTDGKTVARGKCNCNVPKNEDGEALAKKLEQYLKEKEMDAFTIALPKKVVSDLQKMGTQVEQFNLVITERHIFMAPNNCTVYIASLGAKFFNVEKMAEEWVNKEKHAEVVVDAMELKSALDLMLKFMDVSGNGNSPILMTVTGNDVLLEQTEGKGGSTRLKVVESSASNKVTYCFNGKKVMDTLNSLMKGNLKMSFAAEANTPVMFSNGSLDQEILNGQASFVLPVKRREVEDEAASDTKATSSEDESKNEETA